MDKGCYNLKSCGLFFCWGNLLRVAIDARWHTKSSGGIVTYLLNLLTYLARMDGENRYYIIYNDEESRRAISRLCGSPPNFNFVACSSTPYSLREQVELPHLLFIYKCELLHSPHFMIPLSPMATKLIINIHDLIPLIFRRYLPPSSKVRRYFWLYSGFVQRCARCADHIITGSHNSARDVISLLGVFPQRVSVIYHAVAPSFRAAKDSDEINASRRRLGISKPYLLFVGRQDYNKNLRTVVEAFLILRRMGYDLMLVLVTEPGEYYHQVEGYIREDGAEGDVVVTGTLPYSQIPPLYQGALALLIPSLYEGFGLPALEAMACGTPVISSHLASLPEVVSGAGIYVHPEREDQIVEAVVRLIEEDGLREKLSGAGILQAGKFRWEDIAGRTIELYRQVVAR